MKKIFLAITFVFLISSSYAVDYGIKLFSWNDSSKEVLSYFMNNGWSMSLDDNLVHFDVPSNDNYYFQNKLLKIKSVVLGFDKDKNIVAQTFMFDNDYSLSTAFMAMLSAAVNDNVSFYKQDYEKQNNGVDNLYYYARLPDNTETTFILIGKDDYYMFCISYYKPQ